MIALESARLLVGAATWLLTWTLHATIASAVALGAGRWLVQSPRQRDVLWKTALLLPLASATLTSAGVTPARLLRDIDIPALVRPAWPGGNQYRVERRTRRSDAAVVTRTFATDTVAVDVSAAALAGGIALAFAGLSSVVRRHRVFRRRLGRRVPVTELPDEDALADASFPMRVTMSPALEGPVALGWSEICVPSGFFEALTDSQQRGVLRHEAAHLERHDPFWFAAADILVALAPWQPLIRPLVRAMRRDAEFACDDAVVDAMGDGRALVQSFAVFARPFDPRESVLAARCNGSPLEERARRILAPSGQRGGGPLGLAVVAALVLLCSLAFAAPAVTTRTVDVRPPTGTVPRIIRVTDSVITIKQLKD